MKAIVRALAATALMAASVLPSMAAGGPEGIWEIEYRDSRYDINFCGDGTQLCAKLIWLGNGADNEENMPYLNTMLLEGATAVAPGRWKGTLNLYGHKAAGTITQVGQDQLALQGCFLAVICKTFQLYRYTK